MPAGGRAVAVPSHTHSIFSFVTEKGLHVPPSTPRRERKKNNIMNEKLVDQLQGRASMWARGRATTSRHKRRRVRVAALSSRSRTYLLTRCLHLRDRLVPKPKIHIRRIEHQDGLQRYVRDEHHIFTGQLCRRREVKVRRARDFGLLCLQPREFSWGIHLAGKRKKTSPEIVVPDSQAWSLCSWAPSATVNCPSWADRVKYRQGRCDHRSTTGRWKI